MKQSIEGTNFVPYKEVTTLRIRDGEVFDFTHPLAEEEPLEIRIDGILVAVIMRTPGHEKELAAGFCYSEGYVTSFSSIALIEHCTSEGRDVRNTINIRLSSPDALKREIVAPTMPAFSGCGVCGRGAIEEIIRKINQVDSRVTVKLSALQKLNDSMESAQTLFQSTGSVHAAAMFDNTGKLLCCHEDLGRHNALDKVIGHCLIRGIDMTDKVLMLSGRASFEMISKAAMSRIPVIASISAPTLQAVQLGETLNCTIIGFLRGRGMNIYTHKWRIEGI